MSKFTVFFGCNESGVAWWRAKQPAYKLMEKGLCNVTMFSVYDTVAEEDASALIDPADIVYIPCASGIQLVAEFLKYYEIGKKTVADYDDNMFDCHYLNPAYKTLGLREVHARVNGKEQYIWKDERNGFSIKDNKIRHASYTDILQIADSLTSTTPYLANEIKLGMQGREMSDITILPNSIDFNIFRPLPHKVRTGSKLRIGWAASDSHLLESKITLNIIEKLHAKRSDFEFVILGNIHEFRTSERAKKLPLEWHEFVDLGIYPTKLASLELDIAICPLEDVSFNRCKSQLKWSEYSSLSIPSVCQDLAPYHCIKDGEDGILASTSEDFVLALEYLMDNSEFRKRMGEAAFQRNYEDFNLDEVVYDWFEMFERTLSKDRKLFYKGQEIQRRDRLEKVSV